jgi:hypothetical protein
VRARCARADLSRRDALQLENALSQPRQQFSFARRAFLVSLGVSETRSRTEKLSVSEKRRRRLTRFDGPTLNLVYIYLVSTLRKSKNICGVCFRAHAFFAAHAPFLRHS